MYYKWIQKQIQSTDPDTRQPKLRERGAGLADITVYLHTVVNAVDLTTCTIKEIRTMLESGMGAELGRHYEKAWLNAEVDRIVKEKITAMDSSLPPELSPVTASPATLTMTHQTVRSFGLIPDTDDSDDVEDDVEDDELGGPDDVHPNMRVVTAVALPPSEETPTAADVYPSEPTSLKESMTDADGHEPVTEPALTMPRQTVRLFNLNSESDDSDDANDV